MLADLHSHTYFSDGTLDPAALITRAIANQVTHLAITDHDTTEAFDHIPEQTDAAGLILITGVEISSLWDQREIHIVGVGIDRHHEVLRTLLTRQQQLRHERAMVMDMRLQKAGITGLARYLETLPCKAISRNHVAQFLMDQGVARSKDHAFKNFLGDRGRFSAQAQWCTMDDAISAVQAAGGLAVLAHPNRYNISNQKMRRLVEEFSACKGDAIEVSYSNLDPNGIAHMAQLCESNNLWASTGSDFHTPLNHWMDLGRFRHLPQQCAARAVWLHPGWPGHEQ